MAGSFSADLSAFIRHFGGNMDKTVRHAVVLVSQGVIMSAPVDTGRLRSNWQFGRELPPQGELTLLDTSGAAAIARIAGQVTSLKAGGECWIVNNLPYAGKIEYGHSWVKAPRGMVRITLANLPAAIESYVRDLQ
jgi:hypothetical protein